MATAPSFVGTAKVGAGTVTTAEASRTAPTNVTTVISGGTNGTRIDAVRCVATSTTTAGMIRLFIYNGSTYFLWKEIPVTAVTPSATTPAWNNTSVQPFDNEFPIILPNGYSLRATTEKTETFNIIAVGGDF